MNIDPKLLLQLVAIIDEGSLTGASNALRVTQPTLTRSLRILESRLSVPLVDRGRHGARATEFGDRIARYGRMIHEVLERAAEDAEAWSVGSIGILNVGVTPLAATLIPPVLAEFLADRPGVSVRMTESGLPPLLEGMERGMLDLFIGPMGMVQTPPGVVGQHLFDDELVVVCGAGHPLASARSPRREELEQTAWLGHPSESLIKRQTEAVLAAARFSNIRVQAEPASTPIFMGLLHSGQFVSMLPKRFVANEVAAGRVKVVDFELEGTGWPIGVFHRKDPAMPAIVRSFAETLAARL